MPAGQMNPSTKLDGRASTFSLWPADIPRQGGAKGLSRYLMEEVQKQAIVGLLPKVLLQDAVNTRL